MTREEQLTEVKKSLNVTGTALDDTLGGYLDEVKLYMVNAGVNALVVNTTEAIGCICRGVADLYINNELSQYFYQRVSQLAMAIVVTPDPTPAVTITAVNLTVNSGGYVRGGEVLMSDGSAIEIDLLEIDELALTATPVRIFDPDGNHTTVTVTPSITDGNHYLVKTNTRSLPAPDEDMTALTGWSAWDGVSDITADAGNWITVVECDENELAKKAGAVLVEEDWSE